jgi:hypothetical protein
LSAINSDHSTLVPNRAGATRDGGQCQNALMRRCRPIGPAPGRVDRVRCQPFQKSRRASPGVSHVQELPALGLGLSCRRGEQAFTDVLVVFLGCGHSRPFHQAGARLVSQSPTPGGRFAGDADSVALFQRPACSILDSGYAEIRREKAEVDATAGSCRTGKCARASRRHRSGAQSKARPPTEAAYAMRTVLT